MGSSKGNTKGNNRVYNQIETLARIKKVLQENGIDTSTQAEIEKYFGVVPSAISNWANDNKPIGLEKLIKVSSDFNVPLDWLVFGIEQSEEEPAKTKKEPDSLKTVQTEKDIEDYTVADVCKAFIALSECADMGIEIIPPAQTDEKIFQSLTVQISPKEIIQGMNRHFKWQMNRDEKGYGYFHIVPAGCAGVFEFLINFKKWTSLSIREKKLFLSQLMVSDNLPAQYKDTTLLSSNLYQEYENKVSYNERTAPQEGSFAKYARLQAKKQET